MLHCFTIEADCSPDAAADLLVMLRQRLEDEDGALLSFVCEHPEELPVGGDEGSGT